MYESASEAEHKDSVRYGLLRDVTLAGDESTNTLAGARPILAIRSGVIVPGASTGSVRRDAWDHAAISQALLLNKVRSVQSGFFLLPKNLWTAIFPAVQRKQILISKSQGRLGVWLSSISSSATFLRFFRRIHG